MVATLVQPPARFALGQHELFTRAWRPPPHQRLALVVHNPADLLSGSPPWLPGLLLQQGVRLRPGAVPTIPEREAARQLQAAGDGGVGGGAPPRGPPSPLLQLLALSPNVAAYTQHLIQTWAQSVLKPGPALRPTIDVPWLPPLVPWQPSGGGGGDGSEAERPVRHLCMQVRASRCPALSRHKGRDPRAAGGVLLPAAHALSRRHGLPLTITSLPRTQGAIDPKRRDYAAAFAAASHPAVLAALRGRREALLLVGHLTPRGLPPMPAALRPHVRVAADLEFKVGGVGGWL